MKKLKYLVLTKTVGFLLNILSIFNPKKAAKIAYGLHSKPRIGQLKANNLPSILQTAQQATFYHQNHKYQTYTWAGNHQTILLVHGWESNSSRWEKLLPYLQKTGKTIIAIDAPAHGLSGDSSFSAPKYATIIAHFAKTTKIDYLIGHSIGGAASIFYQFRNQNPDIKKMIILGAPSDLQVLIDNFVQLLSLCKPLKKYLTAEFSDQLGLPAAEFSAQQFGATIATPVLVVHDQNDAVVAFSESQKTIKNWKNATFIATQNLGHSMHNPDLYNHIVDYLEL